MTLVMASRYRRPREMSDRAVLEKPPRRLSPTVGIDTMTSRTKETPMNATQKTAKTTSSTGKTAKVFTDDERDAIQQRAKEMKAATRRGATEADGESEVLAKIAEMSASDRDMAERIHAVIKTTAPDLVPKTWYGQPAYAKDGKVICFFQPAQKFKTRYATLGFSDDAKLDEGTMWPVAFALTTLTAADKARIVALVKKAAS